MSLKSKFHPTFVNNLFSHFGLRQSGRQPCQSGTLTNDIQWFGSLIRMSLLIQSFRFLQ